MDGTVVNANDAPTYPPNGTSSGKRASPEGSNNEDDLNRFVTDDAPRTNRIPQADKGLIVSDLPAFLSGNG